MASPGSSGMTAYPHLQGAAAMVGQSSSVSTLGNQYESNFQQRQTGGRLRRAAPARGESTKTKVQSTKPKREQDANIDPALVGPASSSSSTGSEHTVTPAAESGTEEAGWLRDVRIIEDCLQLVKGMINNPHYNDGPSGLEEHGTSGERSGDSDDMEIERHDVSYPELPGLAK